MDFASGNPLVTALVVAALLVWVVTRQLTDRPVTDRRTMLVPLVLTVLGVLTLLQAHAPVTTVGLALTGVELLLVVGLGVLRGRSVRLFVRDGVLHQRGGAVTLALWVLTIGLRIGLGLLAVRLGAGALESATLLASLGLSLLVQGWVLRARATTVTSVDGAGTPHARIGG
ncbi:hypothetical protein LWC33_01465 [Pseudonocardia sp. RS11V-5]|uniref:hypothetical protein n=1 Tax=Pseudonocardia terrae TaxID=2905831 RepID=UPI001E496390|nr:hypothetical protein [Pseudonocardia terrae]MCE3550121.1 hypothetical protein [Pseudonocardia terrae]